MTNTTVQMMMESGIDPSEIYVLTREGLAELTREIFKNVNNRIEERIVTELNTESDTDHVASANTVFNSIKGFSTVKNLVIASGNIAEAYVAPDPRTLYVVRKSTSDTNAIMYVWIEGVGYVKCGGTGSSSGGSTDDFNFNAIPNDIIQEIVSNSFNETDPGIDDEEEPVTPADPQPTPDPEVTDPAQGE